MEFKLQPTYEEADGGTGRITKMWELGGGAVMTGQIIDYHGSKPDTQEELEDGVADETVAFLNRHLAYMDISKEDFEALYEYHVWGIVLEKTMKTDDYSSVYQMLLQEEAEPAFGYIREDLDFNRPGLFTMVVALPKYLIKSYQLKNLLLKFDPHVHEVRVWNFADYLIEQETGYLPELYDIESEDGLGTLWFIDKVLLEGGQIYEYSVSSWDRYFFKEVIVISNKIRKYIMKDQVGPIPVTHRLIRLHEAMEALPEEPVYVMQLV